MGYAVQIVMYILTLTAIATVVYGAWQREVNNSKYIILVSLAISFFALGSQVVLMAESAETAFLGFRLQHIGQPFIGGLWVMYTLEICKERIKSIRYVALLMAIPVFMCLSITAGDPFGFFIRSLTFDNTGLLPTVSGDYTAMYYIGLGHVYGFNLASVYLICRSLSGHDKKNKARYIVHLVAGLVPSLLGIASLVMGLPFRRETVSAVLCVSSVVLNVYLQRTGVMKVVSKAKYQLFESVEDGIVIVNNRNEYMDSNDKARLIFPVLAETAQGTPIKNIEGFFPIPLTEERQGKKFTVTSGGEPKHYTVTRSELYEDEQYFGSTYLIYDITELEDLTIKLQELAITDELTQISNRRNFFSLAESMVATMMRLDIGVCVGMLDIDNFKKVNDTYGHPFGDVVLREVASKCKALLRQSDILGRYGGEEFVIMYYGMDADSVRGRFEHIRQSISEMEISRGDIATSVTVSIGFTFVDFEVEQPLLHAISQADFALYRAKQTGRNKVCGFVDNRIDP